MKIDNFTETMLWASIRYFVGRQSITAVTFANDIVCNLIHKMSDEQKNNLRNEISEQINTLKKISHPPLVRNAEENELRYWLKLVDYLTPENKYVVKVVDDLFDTECFLHNSKYVPITVYKRNPGLDCYIDDTRISYVTKFNEYL